MSSYKYLTAAVLFSYCWFISSSLWVYPHSLSYFNEVIGGPLNGPRHLLGSNVDWGQDLRYLEWIESAPVKLTYFGGLRTKRIFNGLGSEMHGNYCEPLTGRGAVQSQREAVRHAVSVNRLYDARWASSDVQMDQLSPENAQLALLSKRCPASFVGYSIRMFFVE